MIHNYLNNVFNFVKNRLGWLILILLFTYFAFSICVDQVLRFLNGSIVISLEKDYRNWAYDPMALTICTDYLHESVFDKLIQNFGNASGNCDAQCYIDFQHFFSVANSITASNMDRLIEFEQSKLFLNLTGEDLLAIVTEVNNLNDSTQ